MAIAVVTSVSVGSTAGGAITTSARDTTGANLIFIGVSDYEGVAGYSTITDSKGNTWTELTKKLSATTNVISIYYCSNPTVGSGHTFSANSGHYQSICVLAVSGAKASSPFDVQNGAFTLATNVSTGNVTPSENNEIAVTALGLSFENGVSIDTGFILQESVLSSSGNHMGGYLAYKIQTTATTVNPTWTNANSVEQATVIATFKAAPSGSVGASAGVGSATAAGAALDNSVGSAAGIGAATAVGKATDADVGASAGTGAATAVGSSVVAGVGTCAGTCTVTGAAGWITGVGSAAGTSTALGVSGAVGDWDYEPRRAPVKKKKPKEIFQTVDVITPSQGTHRRYKRNLDNWEEIFFTGAALGDDDVLLAMALLET